MQQPTKSDKINIITKKAQKKFKSNIESGKNEACEQKIRNSKYKNKHKNQTFSLFDYITVRVKKPKVKARHRCHPIGLIGSLIKNRGKKREDGKKRKTRLKKSILRYRLKKRQEEEATEAKVKQLAIDHNELQSAQLEHCKIVEKCQQQQKTKEITNCMHKKLTKKQFDNDEVKYIENALQNMSIRIHSRRFRDYCDNCTTVHLAQVTEQLLRDLDRFQKRAFLQNEIKARAHRRFVIGFRETQNYLNINKVKLIIMATDCEESPGTGGLDETIAVIKNKCLQRVPQVPYAFALLRRQMAYILYKKVPISCVAILDYDGANATYIEVLHALTQARADYENLRETREQILSEGTTT